MGQYRIAKFITNDILSPPTTPKRNTETYFYSQSERVVNHSNDYHYSTDTLSSCSSLYSPFTMNTSYSIQSYAKKPYESDLCIMEPLLSTIHVKDSYTPFHRRKQRPETPIHSTIDTFTLPIEPLLRCRKSMTTLGGKSKASLDQAKRRHYKTIDCATSPKLSCLAKKTKVGKKLKSKPFESNCNIRKSDKHIFRLTEEDTSYFNHITADGDLAALFKGKEDWIPNPDVFKNRAGIRIVWKGSPLKIHNMPLFEKLHSGEVPIAATLRLMPAQYLKCKYALVLAAYKATQENTMFRKSEAQKVCCIDVNKSSVLWKVFGKLGWLGPKWPN
ncbi:hypothetical protein BY458DRAFT_460182 [Sporodiniella umbellata]|nr:hypothetical protein BY458DRAFT_460182 [Sporodiniella umbellata]